MTTRIKAADRATLEAHAQRVEEIRQATKLGVKSLLNETKAAREARKANLLADYGKFCEYYFSEFCTAPMAKFHKAFAKDLLADRHAFLVNVWPRAHAKSMNGSVMAPIWLMLQGETKYMVLVSANEDLAKSLMSDIQAQLEGNELLTLDFGNLVGSGSWSAKEFNSSTGTRFKAFGRGEKIRGLRKGANRPDLVVIDDVDDDELCRNPALVKKLYQRLISAVYGTFSPSLKKPRRWVVLGNLISKTSVIALMSAHTKAKVSRVDAWDAKGKLAWPENYSKADIDSMIEGYDSYVLAQKELFNNPITEGGVFKQEWMQFKPRLDWKDYDYLVCYTDPSFKNRAVNDFKATILLGKKGTEYHILRAYVEQATTHRMVEWHYEIHEEISGKKPVYFYMESNFIQDLLFEEFKKMAEAKGYHVPIGGDNRKKPDKLQRIETISPLFERGFIFFNEEEQKSPSMNRLIEQFLCIEKGSRAPDDGPDAVEGAIFMLNQKTKTAEPPVWISTGRGRGRGRDNW